MKKAGVILVMPTLWREKVWPFTLLAAVVSTLGSVAPAGGPWCACRVRWGCIIVVSPRWRILVSECQGIFSTVPIPIANEEQKATGRRWEEGEESIHISICEMCQTPILFAQGNNSSAKTSRGDTKIYFLKHRTDFFSFLNFPQSFLDLIVWIVLGNNISGQTNRKFTFLKSSTG